MVRLFRGILHCFLIAAVILLIAVSLLWLSGYDIPLYQEISGQNPRAAEDGETAEASGQTTLCGLVIPGGQSVGVSLDVKDVLVVGLEELTDEDGNRCNPGLAAGLQIGDTIISIDGTEVQNASDVQGIVENTRRKTIRLKVGRKGELLNLEIHPVKTEDEGVYRLGLWVREKTAGIGTLTFYMPENGAFAALGHGISDPETGIVYKVSEGQLLNARILSLKEGKKGSPGELRGIFYEADEPLGRLECNTTKGIYGIAYEELNSHQFSGPVPIASASEVEKGPAEILTTISGSSVRRYSVEIQRIMTDEEEKNMVIRVTDPQLIKASGGIIQGMSGSPILQNGKLVGAVTHVLVNDPEKGYGIFAETMYREAAKLE